MRTRSVGRTIASLTTGTLAAGMLLVAPLVTATSAHAQAGPIQYTCNLGLTGGFASYGGDRAATLTFDTDAPATLADGATATPTLTAKLRFADEYIALFKPSPVNRMGGTLTAVTDTAGTAGTSLITFEQWNRDGAMGSDVPAFDLTGTGPWGTVTGDDAGVELGVSTLSGTLFIGTSFSPNNTQVPTTCTPDNQPATTVVDTVEAPAAPTYNSVCVLDLSASGFGGKESFDASVTSTLTPPASGQVGTPLTGTLDTVIDFAPTFEAYLKTSPTIKLKPSALAPKVTVGSAAGTGALTFTEWVRVWSGQGSPIGQDVNEVILTGTGTWKTTPTAAGVQPVSISSYDGTMAMTVSFGNATMEAPLTCTPKTGEAQNLGSVNVAPAPAVATTTALGVTPATGKATLKATVSPAAAAGKVTFYDGAKVVGSKALVGGSATVAVAATSGSHAYKAVFAPTNAGAFKASTSAVRTVVIKAATSTKVKAKGAKKKATVTVTVAGGSTKATGKVKLVLKKGKAKKSATVTLRAGTGKVTVKKLKKGKWTITATYAGDATHVGSAGKGSVKVK